MDDSAFGASDARLSVFGGMSDVRLTVGDRHVDSNGPSYDGYGDAVRLQAATSGLLVSLTSLSNTPGPPLYSPPPTYDQVRTNNLALN